MSLRFAVTDSEQSLFPCLRRSAVLWFNVSDSTYKDHFVRIIPNMSNTDDLALSVGSVAIRKSWESTFLQIGPPACLNPYCCVFFCDETPYISDCL